MKPSTSFLLKDMREAQIRPTVNRHHCDGRMSLLWYVDDDNDRYVEATDSIHSSKVVLIARDGYCEWLKTAVLSEPKEIVEWIKCQLEIMSHVQSRYGRPVPVEKGWVR